MKNILKNLLINNAIFNNNQKNKAFNLDVFDLDIKVDLVYIDPPYIPQKGSLTYYRDFYHFLEGITDYNNWFQNIDYKSKNKKLSIKNRSLLKYLRKYI